MNTKELQTFLQFAQTEIERIQQELKEKEQTSLLSSQFPDFIPVEIRVAKPASEYSCWTGNNGRNSIIEEGFASTIGKQYIWIRLISLRLKATISKEF
jgi:hypothetical protein